MRLGLYYKFQDKFVYLLKIIPQEKKKEIKNMHFLSFSTLKQPCQNIENMGFDGMALLLWNTWERKYEAKVVNSN